MNRASSNAEPRLPLPNPDEWLTLAAAAALLCVHYSTVIRMSRQGILTAYSPVRAEDEKSQAMFWAAEVEQLRDARRKAGLQRG